MQAISTFMPLLKSKRAELKSRGDKESQFLLKMVAMFLFHAHLLLLKSDEFTRGKKEFKSEEKKQEVRNYFSQLLKSETSLPVQFCVDILTKYLMFDEALLFLFYRKDYSYLLDMIRKNYEKEQKKVAEIVTTYRESKSGSSSSMNSASNVSKQQRQ
jgi:hypothetical protein